MNIQPDPVKFLQLSSSYWSDWTQLGYNPPPNCRIAVNESCPAEALLAPGEFFKNITLTHCQICTDGAEPYSYLEWIFTVSPGLFGYPNGVACITGVCLLFILSIMVWSINVLPSEGQAKLSQSPNLAFTCLFLIFQPPYQPANHPPTRRYCRAAIKKWIKFMNLKIKFLNQAKL